MKDVGVNIMLKNGGMEGVKGLLDPVEAEAKAMGKDRWCSGMTATLDEILSR
jgi:hypothetical protein